MERNHNHLKSVLACLLALASGAACAQGRGPEAQVLRDRMAVDPAVARAAELADLDARLRRLTGKFRMEIQGRAGASTPEAMRDCVSIGEGAGVHCVESWGITAQTSGVPTMILYGLETRTPGVRYLQVSGRSIAEGDVGRLSGNTLSFSRVQCPVSVEAPENRAMVIILSCQQQVRIYAPPDSEEILIQTHTMQRVQLRPPPTPPPPGAVRPPRPPERFQVLEYTTDIRLIRLRE